MEKATLTPEYKLPFGKYDKICELGGGEQPLFHPNVDIRWLPSVDIIASLEHPLPIANAEYEGVFSRYVVEHISWRKVRGLLAEIYRILKPGGVAVLVIANLLEQAKALISAERWDDRHICTIFGDQNYPGGQWDANAHHCGFSPEYIIRLLKEAGFYEVKVFPIVTELGPTDMIAEAWKSEAKIL